METNVRLEVQSVVIADAETGAPVGRATCRAIVEAGPDGRMLWVNIRVHDVAWSPDDRPSLGGQRFELVFRNRTRLRGSFPDYTPGAFAAADAGLAFAPGDLMQLAPPLRIGGPGVSGP
jgi:hypothetical protein